MESLSPAPDWVSASKSRQFRETQRVSRRRRNRSQGRRADLFANDAARPTRLHLVRKLARGFKRRSHALSLGKAFESILFATLAFWQAGETDPFASTVDQSDLLAELARMPIATISKWSEKALSFGEVLARRNRDSSLVFEQFWIESQNP